MGLLLVADIGGTNARFGLVEPAENNSTINYLSQRQITLKCADHRDMGSMIKAYCAELKIDIPLYACLAIAGPIDGDEAQMTNLKWKFSITELAKQLNMKSLFVINDFAAHAYAIPFLKTDEMKTLFAANTDPKAPIVVMGPGTGFGMALLVPGDPSPNQEKWKIIPTEGGHASFAPTTEKELAIKSFLLKEQTHVSVENILSGAGLVTLYRALAHIAGVSPKNFTPADVSAKGLANEDAICHDAVLTFCNTLGAVAGDKALSTGARGGVVITGGITPRLLDILPSTHFIERYKNKGPMRNYVSDISIRVVLNENAALVGSAAWLIHHTPELM
jgi:glucokinase